MSPINECNAGMKLWKRLGWLPYCPRRVRKHLPFIKAWFIPYNLIQYKRTGKLRLWY